MKSLASLAALCVLVTACGGKPPKTADDTTTSVATTSPAAAEDMPPASTSPAPASTPDAKSAEATPTPAAAPAIKIVALHLVVPAKDAKKLGTKALEVKDDGTIASDGKPVMKLAGSELQEIEHGSTIFAVAADGSVTGASGNAVGKFGANDELVFTDGGKLAVSDEGLMQLTDGKGKMTVLGPKFDSAPAWSKREAALVGLSLVGYAALGDAFTPMGQKKPAPKAPAKKK